MQITWDAMDEIPNNPLVEWTTDNRLGQAGSFMTAPCGKLEKVFYNNNTKRMAGTIVSGTPDEWSETFGTPVRVLKGRSHD